MIIIKLLILLLVPLVLVLPFLPLRWIFSFSFYASPNVSRRRTLINIAALAALAIACVILIPFLRNLALVVGNLKPIRWVLEKIPGYASYSTDLLVTIFVDVIYCFAAFVLLLIIRGGERVADSIKSSMEKAKAKKKKLKKKLSEADEEKKKKETPEAEKKEPMPSELLPEPEEPVTTNQIVLPGRKIEKKKQKAKKKAAAAPEEQPAEKKGLAKLADIICGTFYESVDDEWHSRPQTFHVSRHLRNFLCLVGGMYVLAFILLLIPVLFHVKVMENWIYRILQFFITVNYLYPVLALSILVLVFRLFNGKPAPVSPTEADEDAALRQSGRIVDLDQVEANLMKTCGKDYDVLSFYSSDVMGNGVDRQTVDLSEDSVIRSVADYVVSEGLELNQEYLLGIKGFTEGKNVLFHAPLYTAVGAYIYAALNLRILQGERVVVICRNRSQIPNYIEQMNQGLQNLTRTHKPLWKIVTRKQLGRDAEEDILVLTPEDFLDDSLFSASEEFFSQVSVALLPDANLVVASNNYYCQMISQRLRQTCRKTLQYIFLSTRTALNLDNALTEFFLLDSKPVYARGDYSYGDVHVYVWRAKRDGPAVLDNAARTMVLEVCISDVANRFGITEPNLISDSAIYSNQINPHWLDIYDATKRPLGFAIVADDSFNLPSVIHAYSRYIGKKASVIHVITRQYLLRDYFYSRAPRYLFEQPLMERSMVEHAKQDKTAMVLLLCRLMEGIPVVRFIEEMNRLGHGSKCDETDYDAIRQLVNECLRAAIGDLPPTNQEHFTLYQPTDVFYPVEHIRVHEDYDVLSRLMEETNLIQIRFWGGEREPVYINLFSRMLDQRYLTGQNLVYANQNYEIKRVDRDNGVIEVDDASNVHGLARDYVQLRDYRLQTPAFAQDCRVSGPGRKPADPALQLMRKEFIGGENIATALFMARSETSFRISSDTYGYYIIQTDGRSLSVMDSTIPVIRLEESKREQLQRTVSGGVYLRLELTRARDDRLTMTLAALLQEMMKTLFPDCYFCLSVCPILEDPASIYDNPDVRSRAIAQLYPRLEDWGDVLPNSIELLIVDDCAGGTGAMNLIFEQEGTYIQNVLWMLSDYLEWQSEDESRPYIYFGMDEQPDIFDLDGLRPILQSFARNYVREHDIHSQLDAANRCMLCGMKIDEPFLWKGKHMICQRCSEEYAPDEEEAAQILDYARTYLEETFAVKLPEMQIRVEPQLPEDALSALDLESGTILLTEELPLRAMHVQIMTQLVRCWQLTNLDITGDNILDGQCLYVVLQYLRYLKQYQYAQHLHRDYLLGEDDASQGYCRLLQALQAENHDNSFLYLLQQYKKSGGTPVKKPVKKKPIRVPTGQKVNDYYRATLTPEEAAAYDSILDGLLSQSDSIDVRAHQLTEERLDHVVTCVFRDHPEVFWCNGNYKYLLDAAGIAQEYQPIYTVSPEERERLQGEIDQSTAELLEVITDDMEDYDVALTLYERLIEFLDYDTLALERQERMSRQSRAQTMDDLRNIYGAIVKHKAVCAGYARAYQYLLRKFGLEALYAAGECFEGGRHAWTIVRLEGDYYHVDVTWGDQSNTDPTKNHEGMTYAYFAVTDEQICKSRSIDPVPPPPKCTSENCNYFVRNGLYFTKYDPIRINEKLVELLSDPKRSLVEMRFGNLKLLHDAEFFLCRNGGFYEALRKAGREASSISHVTRDDLNLLSIIVQNE